MKNIAFIINPISGAKETQSAKRKLPKIIMQTLDTDQWLPNIVFTEYAGHATEMAYQFARMGFDAVVAVGGDELVVGTPFVEGYGVQAEVLEQGKADKVIIYKYKAKKDYRRKNGHRQPYTLVKVTGIGTGMKAAKKESAAKAEAPEEKAPKANASMKKDELLAIANKMGIEVAAKATKADILAAIEAK